MVFRPVLSLSTCFISTIIRSYRYKAINDSFLLEAKRPPLFALFHSVQMLVASYKVPFRTNILVSLSKDGDIAAGVLKNLGFGVVRGSSSRRGKEALLELEALVKDGESAAITVDGPKGPAGEVKSGIIRLAYKTGVPIVCVSAASRPMFRLRRSWDKFVVAPPFAGVCICFSEPLYIQGDNLRDGTDYYKRQIKEILHSLSEKSLKMLCEDAEKCDI